MGISQWVLDKFASSNPEGAIPKKVLNKIAQAKREEATSLDLSLSGLSSVVVLDSLFYRLSQLPKLTTLDLSFNKLSAASDLDALFYRLSQLPKLTTLYLSGNELSSVSESIGTLSGLTTLHLYSNSLTVLPESIVKLTQLTYLDLRKNRLNLPPELAGVIDSREGVERLFEYLRQLYNKQKASRPLNEAKVILVGEAKTGKTSLVKRLTTGTFDPNEPKTDGIDIHRWNLDGVTFPDNKGTNAASDSVNEAGSENETRTIRVNLWDLGGQEIYHATHQFFLTERTLYLLVLSARSTDEQNRLHYWLKTIRALGKDAPILIVHNQYEANTEQLDRKQLREKYPSIVPGGFLETSCSEDWGIAELKAAIQRELGKMRHVADPLPASYFAVKEQLEQVTQTKDFLDEKEYEVLCAGVGVEEEDLRENILHLLHALGTVVCFLNDLRLRDTNVLNPEWVTEGVYSVLNDPTLTQAGDGILTAQALSTILRGAKRTYPRNRHQYILDMMEKFELCFPHRDKPGEYLIPELLHKSEPDDVEDDADALRLELWYDFLPSSVLPRFIVRTSLLPQPYRWGKGVVLMDGENRALVRADSEASKVTIAVSGPRSTRRDFLSVIRNHFAQIHRVPETLTVEEYIPLADYPNAKPVPYLFLQELDKDRETHFRWQGVPVKLGVGEMLDGISRRVSETQSGNQDLRARMTAGLSLEEVAMLWYDLLGGTMNAAIPNNSQPNAIVELLDRLEKRQQIPSLLAELKRAYPHVLKELPA